MVEILWRGRTHWTMALLGGLCFVLIGELNEHIPWETPLWKQGLIGSCIVTSLEFVFGLVLNVYLNLGVWDYSNLPLNIMGQVSILFSFLWIFVSIGAVIFDDYLRYWWFHEDKPKYKII